MVVCMEHLVQMDPTLLSIAYLEPGWVAVRDVVGGEWERYQDDEMNDLPKISASFTRLSRREHSHDVYGVDAKSTTSQPVSKGLLICGLSPIR